MAKVREFAQLNIEERIKIEVLLQENLSYSAIGRALNRPVCTISREVKRNGSRKYGAARAQSISMVRHRVKCKHTVFDQAMIDFIVFHLETSKWSPVLISVLGRKWRPDFVSHEWIYHWIWKMKFSKRKDHKKYELLYQFLRHGKRRRRRGNSRTKRGNIIGREWIDKRPKAANKRKRQGDLEADIVLGKGRRPGLLVAIDRKTRKTWIRKLKNKEAEHVMGKLTKLCSQIGNVITVTLDNDLAFAKHYKLNKLGIKTFFTHPYSSQEKGSVENRIGVIRRFFPKKTDFDQVTEKLVREVQKLINQRPMRMFKYKSSNDIYIS